MFFNIGKYLNYATFLMIAFILAAEYPEHKEIVNLFIFVWLTFMVIEFLLRISFMIVERRGEKND